MPGRTMIGRYWQRRWDERIDMCGIVGIIDHAGGADHARAARPDHRHRGPDGDGFFQWLPPRRAWRWVRRLSIID